jgi:hypothetical protein
MPNKPPPSRAPTPGSTTSSPPRAPSLHSLDSRRTPPSMEFCVTREIGWRSPHRPWRTASSGCRPVLLRNPLTMTLSSCGGRSAATLWPGRFAPCPHRTCLALRKGGYALEAGGSPDHESHQDRTQRCGAPPAVRNSDCRLRRPGRRALSVTARRKTAERPPGRWTVEARTTSLAVKHPPPTHPRAWCSWAESWTRSCSRRSSCRRRGEQRRNSGWRTG